MKPETLELIGRALYGSYWKTDMAKELGVSFRTVSRWAAGENKMPNEKMEKLRYNCLFRIGELEVLSASLRFYLGP